MSFLGDIFGTKKAVDNVMDKDNGLLAQAGAWIGNKDFTEEERAEMMAGFRQWSTEHLAGMSQFKVVQRIMVFTVCAGWLVLLLNLLAAMWLGNDDVLEQLILFVQTKFAWAPIAAVFTLYTGGGTLESMGRSRKNKG